MKTFYQLNPDNLIMAVGGDWDSFALANNGRTAFTEHVLGRSLWSFVSGTEMRSYLNAVFFVCRERGKQISLPFRCDQPSVSLTLCMTVTPLQNRFLRIENQEHPCSLKTVTKEFPAHAGCAVCGTGVAKSLPVFVCRMCRDRAVGSCDAVMDVRLPDKDAFSQIDIDDALRKRRTALAKDDAPLSLRL